MKTKLKQTIRLQLIAVLLLGCCTVNAQDKYDYKTLSGIVKDGKSKKKIEYASISVPGSTISTVTNTDGEFIIKIKDSLEVKELEVSHIGYSTTLLPITNEQVQSNLTVMLHPDPIKLKDVVIYQIDPYELVKQAIAKVGDNYSSNSSRLTGFYRETVKKSRNYINISEAIIDIYKTPYTYGVNHDKVQILKGRSLLSPKRGDTLAVKMLGGPTLSTYVDIVKNSEFILDPATLHYYKFTMDKSSVSINDRPHYVVDFSPQVIAPYALHTGTLYIDRDNLTISRAEFALDMRDRNKVTATILRKKPFTLRFKPEEVSFVVTYKERGGKSYLHYIYNEVRFKCDWKRKLFSTNYAIVSEMVVTDSKIQDVEKIPNKLAFGSNQSLSDKVVNFYDENFWEDYNIIPPTESLESAIGKLKKQYK